MARLDWHVAGQLTFVIVGWGVILGLMAAFLFFAYSEFGGPDPLHACLRTLGIGGEMPAHCPPRFTQQYIPASRLAH